MPQPADEQVIRALITEWFVNLFVAAFMRSYIGLSVVFGRISDL